MKRLANTDKKFKQILKTFSDGNVNTQSTKMFESYNPLAKGDGTFTVRLKDQYPMARLAADIGLNIHTRNIVD